jgi:hypothetical protein
MTELAFAIYLECIYHERLALNRADAAHGVCPGRVLTRRGWMGCNRPLVRYWFAHQL